MIMVKSIPVGPLSTNCHVVTIPEAQKIFIVDPGADVDKILNAVWAMPEFESVEILLTHAHVDHFFAAGQVAQALNVPCVRLAKADWELYDSPNNEIFPYFGRAMDRPTPVDYEPNEFYEVLPMPGHTPGGVALFFRDGRDDMDSFVICGDSLFSGSIGRTDLPGGDMNALINSIKTQILPLDKRYVIYPGHGIPTTVGRERMTNPFLVDKRR